MHQSLSIAMIRRQHTVTACSVGVMSLLLLGMSGMAAQAATTQSCDKKCLTDMLSSYERSMQHHDAKTLPFSPKLRMTENYKPIKAGEGYWQNIGKIHYQITFADPVSGQIAAVGFLEHGERNAYYSLRLKVENRKISQSEMLLIHKGDASFFEESAAKSFIPFYETTVPQQQRSTREQLIKIADAFTDTWQFRNEDLAPYAAQCDFFENNVKLTSPDGPAGDTCGGMVEYGGKNGVAGAGKAGKTNAPRPAGQPANAGGEPNAGGPSRGARLGDPAIGQPALYGTQMWMRDRRYPVVDVEHGVVFFYHIQGGTTAKPGEKVVYERTGGGTFGGPPAAGAPPPQGNNAGPGPGNAGQGGAGGPPAGGGGAAYMAALMKVVDGKIVRVDHFEWEGGPNASGGFTD